MDEKAQISAEMILIMGALMILVIVAGIWIADMSSSVAGNVSDVVDAARDSSLDKM